MNKHNKIIGKLSFLLNKEQKKRLFILSILLVIGMIFEMVGIGILVPVLSLMVNSDFLIKYPFLSKLFKWFHISSKENAVIILLIILTIIYFIKTIYLAFLSWTQSNFSSNLAAEMSNKLFKGYLNLPYSFHLNKNSAELLRNIQTEVTQFASVSQSTIALASELAIVFGISLMLIIYQPFGAIFVILFMVLSTLFFHLITKKKILKWGILRQFHSKYLNLHLLQGLGGIKDVKIFNKEIYFLNEFTKHNKDFAKIQTRVITLSQIPRLYLEFLAIMSLVILIVINLVTGKDIISIVPIIGVFVAAAFRMMPSVNRIMGAIQQIRFAIPVIQTLYDEFRLIDKPINLNFSNSSMTFENKISVENLTFKYEESQDAAVLNLENINLEIKKGETIGIIGASGSGKSTLIDLILGLLNPTKGNIFCDDFNIDTNLKKWQTKIGYVPQVIYLTDDTLKKNIAFGISEELIEPEKLNTSIKAAQLDSFIENLPNGINTFVGERGVRISGGQRQRIGIARALYNNPDILVLDEATSALDAQIEKEVMNSVYQLKGQKTIIIVAHRLSTLEKCNKVYKVDKGNISLIS